MEVGLSLRRAGAQYNRQALEVGNIQAGDRIVYQIGPNGAPTVATVELVIRSRAPTADILTLRIHGGRAIHVNYVVGILKKYVPAAPVVQTPEEVSYITAARASGKDIYGRLKAHGEEGVWQKQEGNFQFNFSALEYRVGE